ncbi:MAG: hypothetical protein ABIV28_04255 [Longimicrobiales bacterium]
MSDVVVLIGTKRGLFIARSDEQRREWHIGEPCLDGREVYHAITDPRDGSMWAATTHKVWGAHIHRSTDGGVTWDVLQSAPHHADERGLEAVWFLAAGPASAPGTMFAGIEPAGLFVTHDSGLTWNAIDALNNHETRTAWQPAGGALALGSVLIDPRDNRRMYCALSAGGVYRTEDAGASWTPINTGTRAEFMPDHYPAFGQCVHRVVLHPAMPDRLYQQNHCGVYRSDDCGTTWIEITAGLPSEYGYVVVVDDHDADVAYVVPEESSHMRTVVDGKLRVFRTRDAGTTWEPLSHGLPQERAYVSLLREGLAADSLDPCGLYLGTSSGHLFASNDRGESWTMVAGFLPRIVSVTAAVV